MTTTAHMTFRKAAVDVSADNSDWTELDSEGAAVAVTGYGRTAISEHVFDADVPLDTKPGKRQEGSVAVRFMYTEEAAEAFELVRAIYEADGGVAYLRYSPSGDSTADAAEPFRFSTGKGVMSEFVYPQGEANATELIPGGFTITSNQLTKSVVS